jgi:hypothetical protein
LVSLFTGTVGVVCSIGVYLIIFLAINILLKTFTTEERALINGKLPRPLWVF